MYSRPQASHGLIVRTLPSVGFIVQVLAFIVVVVPYALPIRAKYTIPSVHFCYAITLAVNAVYVLTTPSSPIGHPGYFTHKQGLGLLAAVGIILSSHELLHRGWRRLVALTAIGLGFWLIFESQSKSALAFALVAITCSGPILLLCKKTRLTPAFIVAAVVVASMFVSNPMERIGYRLYGDPTLTGRTGIWGFIELREDSAEALVRLGLPLVLLCADSPELGRRGTSGRCRRAIAGIWS